jgi:hypothetical protein
MCSRGGPRAPSRSRRGVFCGVVTANGAFVCDRTSKTAVLSFRQDPVPRAHRLCGRRVTTSDWSVISFDGVCADRATYVASKPDL